MNNTKLQVSHTPTPWLFESHPNGITIWSDERGRSAHICQVTIRGEQGTGEGDANAQFIVQAVNSHNELLEACKVLLGLVESGHLVRDISKDDEVDFALRQLPLVKALKQAQTAIHNATEGKTI